MQRQMLLQNHRQIDKTQRQIKKHQDKAQRQRCEYKHYRQIDKTHKGRCEYKNLRHIDKKFGYI